MSILCLKWVFFPPTCVVQLCKDGDMWTQIEKRGSFYSEKDAADLILQIVSVAAHAHQLGVLHRDIKVYILGKISTPKVKKKKE